MVFNGIPLIFFVRAVRIHEDLMQAVDSRRGVDLLLVLLDLSAVFDTPSPPSSRAVGLLLSSVYLVRTVIDRHQIRYHIMYKQETLNCTLSVR